jgi:hypothetical protein
MTTITGARGERERETRRDKRWKLHSIKEFRFPWELGIFGMWGIWEYTLFRGRAEASERNIFGFKPLPPPASPLRYNHVVLLFV